MTRNQNRLQIFVYEKRIAVVVNIEFKIVSVKYNYNNVITDKVLCSSQGFPPDTLY